MTIVALRCFFVIAGIGLHKYSHDIELVWKQLKYGWKSESSQKTSGLSELQKAADMTDAICAIYLRWC